MTPVCANCDHPTINHKADSGCFYCDCAFDWKTATAKPEPDLPRCRACGCEQYVPYGAQHPDQCRRKAGHLRPHMEGMWRWGESYAVYPEVGQASAGQVGGNHYKEMPIQPWAIIDAFGLGFYEGSALKYLLRAGKKGARLEDLKKARHYLDKMIELESGEG